MPIIVHNPTCIFDTQPNGAHKAMRKTLTCTLFFFLAACTGDEATPERTVEQPVSTAERLGITREDADTLWATATGDELAPLVHKWECDLDGADRPHCVFQLNPAAWASVTVDQKRGFVVGAGKGAAVVHGTDFVSFTDMYTGKRLALYLTDTNTLSLE